MYNIRYHIASIVGIFLSLAIGLILGAAIGGSDSMREISNEMIANLRSDYEKVLNANTKLTAQSDESQKFASEFVAAWMVNRLSGKHIVILADHDSTAGIDRVRDLAERAGATVTVVKIDSGALQSIDDESFAKIIAGAGVESEVSVRANERTQTLAQILSYEWLLAQNGDAAAQQQRKQSGVFNLLLHDNKQISGQPHLMKSLIDAHIISSSTPVDQMNKGFDGVINMAVDKGGNPSIFALELCGQLTTYEVPVVLTQVEPYDEPLLKEAQSRGFSGISNALTLGGSYGIIALLTGAEKGVYGLDGKSAYPPLPKGSSFDGAGSDQAASINETIKGSAASDTQQNSSSSLSEPSAPTPDQPASSGGTE